MNYINYTRHEICLFYEEDVIKDGTAYIVKKEAEPFLIIDPSGYEARARMTAEKKEEDDIVAGYDVPVYHNTYGEPYAYDLETGKETEFYTSKEYYQIVSAPTARACKEHKMETSKIRIPNQLVRDENGNVIGCLSFATI